MKILPVMKNIAVVMAVGTSLTAAILSDNRYTSDGDLNLATARELTNSVVIAAQGTDGEMSLEEKAELCRVCGLGGEIDPFKPTYLEVKMNGKTPIYTIVNGLKRQNVPESYLKEYLENASSF